MLAQHRSHIASTCSTIRQHLEEVRTAISAGKSPGGAALTPLPEATRSGLLDALDRITCELEELAQSFEPERGPSVDAGGLGATRMWVSILLRTSEELLEDLLPARMKARYGPLFQSEEVALSEHVTGLLSALKAALDLADAP